MLSDHKLLRVAYCDTFYTRWLNLRKIELLNATSENFFDKHKYMNSDKKRGALAHLRHLGLTPWFPLEPRWEQGFWHVCAYIKYVKQVLFITTQKEVRHSCWSSRSLYCLQEAAYSSNYSVH